MGIWYPPKSEPLIQYCFDLDHSCNFKGYQLLVKQVIYISQTKKKQNKTKEKITNQHSSTLFSSSVSSSYYSVSISSSVSSSSSSISRLQTKQLLNKPIPTVEELDSGAPTNFNPTQRCTHNLKSAAPLFSFFSSNLTSNQRHFFSSILNQRRHPQFSSSLFSLYI